MPGVWVAMEIKQQLRLSQQLVMTPQLQQAIRLLQLSRLELIEEVRKELDNNPVLSDEEPEQRSRIEPGDVRSGGGDTRLEETGADGAYYKNDDQKVNERAAREVDWEKFLENRTLQQSPGNTRGGFEDLPPIEQNLTKP
ncbi:MAG TPA: RNA polymerase sigma-54 factor, partial [Polyangiaceae bacterium]|nr:RNA polymerase sigma-54 factor [Polyangiaceae bacterium]